MRAGTRHGRRATRDLALTAAALVLAVTAMAQDPAPDATDPAQAILEAARSYTPAAVIDRSAPPYPRSELERGREAWVELSYCIDETGTPQNIVVLDTAGAPSFERAAVEAVRKWRFEPAKLDGQPAWQSNNVQLITFSIDDGVKSGSGQTKRQFLKLGKLIDEGKLAEADVLFEQLIDSDRLNLYELGKIWEQRVRFEALAGDLPRLDLALHRATASDGAWIEKKYYVRLLGIRAKVELQLGNFAEAMSAYRKLAELAGEDDSTVVELRPTIDRLREMVASDAVLKTPAEVRARGGCYGCDDSYWFRPVRRKFAFADVEGELRSIDMRCTHRRFEAPVSELVEWHIPESWGSCSIQVEGQPGTTFNVLALPDDWPG